MDAYLPARACNLRSQDLLDEVQEGRDGADDSVDRQHHGTDQDQTHPPQLVRRLRCGCGRCGSCLSMKDMGHLIRLSPCSTRASGGDAYKMTIAGRREARITRDG